MASTDLSAGIFLFCVFQVLSRNEVGEECYLPEWAWNLGSVVKGRKEMLQQQKQAVLVTCLESTPNLTSCSTINNFTADQRK